MIYGVKKTGSWRDSVKHWVETDDLEKLDHIFSSDRLGVLDKLRILGEILEFCNNQRNKYCKIFKNAYPIEVIKLSIKEKVQNVAILSKIESSCTVEQLMKIYANIRIVSEQFRGAPHNITPVFIAENDLGDSIIGELKDCMDLSDINGLHKTLCKYHSTRNIFSELWILEQVLGFYSEQSATCCTLLLKSYSIQDIQSSLCYKTTKSMRPDINNLMISDAIRSKDKIEDLVKEYMKIRVVERQDYEWRDNQDAFSVVVGDNFCDASSCVSE